MQKELRYAVNILKDEEWKSARNVITPTFTGGKLRKVGGWNMYETHRFLESYSREKFRFFPWLMKVLNY